MKIGITGTRDKITDKQIDELYKFFKTLPEGSELHHGDCVGADYQVAIIAQFLNFKTICHPPVKEHLRAYHDSDETRVPETYLKRNRNIVDEVELLLVVPKQMMWQPQGGTWYTHDYAKKKNVEVKVFWPA